MEFTSLLNWITQFILNYGYFALFLVFFLGLIGLPVPEETLLTFSGFLVYTGHFEYKLTILISYLGTISAMTTAYFIGRKLGYPFVQAFFRRMKVKPKIYLKTEKWFKRTGAFTLFLGYFIPGVRQFTAYFAGITKLSYPQFAAYAYSGGLVWSVTFVTLGKILGENWRSVVQSISKYIGLGSLLIVLLFICFISFYQLSKKGSSR